MTHLESPYIVLQQHGKGSKVCMFTDPRLISHDRVLDKGVMTQPHGATVFFDVTNVLMSPKVVITFVPCK